MYLLNVQVQPLPNSVPPTPTTATTVNKTDQLPLMVLDTIVCALAERPANIRAFEEVGGLELTSRLLRSRQASKSIR